MPRTVDHIVSCHQAAAARVAQGKPVWDRTITIKDILHRDPENESDAHVAAVAAEIAARLRQAVPAAWLDIANAGYDRDLDEVVENLEAIRVPSQPVADPLIEEFNGYLDELYDWADHHRVWVG